jgi:hypothetical protein
MPDQSSDWRELCEAAAKEHDPDKFMALIIELNNALEERERRRDDVGRYEHEKNRRPRSSAREFASNGIFLPTSSSSPS